MSLKGTLKDFGIADILNLIGQQKKTGVLQIRSRSEDVEVSFVDGNVVSALSKTRRSKELLGSMLLRSGLVSQEQLDRALDLQKRTLKRLGDILVAEGAITGEQLREMTELQTTETIFKLFTWNSGTYEFHVEQVDHDQGRGPAIRPESILMEGFRRIDEWPMVRKVIPSLNLAFNRLKHLDPPPVGPGAGVDDLDAALDAAMEAPSRGEALPRRIGRNERAVYKLAEPGVPASRLVDLSRLGEFETCKALYNLVECGFLEAVAAPREVVRARTPSGGSAGLVGPELRRALKQGAAQAVTGLVLVVLFAAAAFKLSARPAASSATVPARPGISRTVVVENQLSRLAAALEIYRLQKGSYPATLRALVDEGIVAEGDLRRPFHSEYHFRRSDRTYVLLPPLE